jgi:hypothetical protein
MHNLIRPTLCLNALPWYNPKSILTHFENPQEPSLDEERTVQAFRRYSKDIYTPLLHFLLDNKVETNLIITARFLLESKKHHRYNLELIRKMVEKNLAIITADCYNGESMSSLYNVQWWAQQMISSVKVIQEELGLTPEYVFVSQIYRSLEIERIVFETGINQFIIRQKGSKLLPFRLRLSEFRRFGGESVSWIGEHNDEMCNFIALPDAQFYEPNQLIFLPNTVEQVRRLSMEIGLNSSLKRLKKTPSYSQKKPKFRLNEHPSMGLFNDLEKSVLRLWEYMSTIILSRFHYQQEDPKLREIYKTYSRIQNKDFLFYLNKKSYYDGAELNFTSPYEAFATMQTMAKKLEIDLENDFVSLQSNPEILAS